MDNNSSNNLYMCLNIVIIFFKKRHVKMLRHKRIFAGRHIQHVMILFPLKTKKISIKVVLMGPEKKIITKLPFFNNNNN